MGCIGVTETMSGVGVIKADKFAVGWREAGIVGVVGVTPKGVLIVMV